MNESDYIDKLWKYLESLGATVKIDFDLEEEFSGGIYYEQKLIVFNESNALKALMTLAHEGGHYLHFLRNPDLMTNRSYQFREQAAYLLGWCLLKKMGVVDAEFVTKDLWKVHGIWEGDR